MFSIVIPLYNKAHIIEKTLASVLAQTFSDFEVVIVNDGSTDSGVDVINKYTNDSRIKIISQKNQGVSVARNKGVESAKYNYIAFLDGDDEWHTTFLEKIKEAIDLYPEAGMFGTSSLHRDVKTGYEHDATVLRYKDKIQLIDYFENPATYSHTSAVVVSKKIFNKIDFNGEGFPVGMKCCEDWSCFYRMAFLSPVVYIGFPLGIRNNNVMGQITGFSDDARFNLLKYVVDFYNLTFKSSKESKNSSLFKIYLKYDIRHRILLALKARDIKTIAYLINNLDKNVLNIFHNIELRLYEKLNFRHFSILYIYITKIIWRRHGYPIVGKS